MELSHSKVQMYLSCPQRYKFHYVDRLPEKPHANLEFGKLIHEVLEFLHNPRNMKTPALEELMEEFEKRWSKLPETEGMADYKPLGIKMLEDYYQVYVPLEEEVLAVEQRFRLPLENHTLVGVLDRVSRSKDGTILITDYKTSKTLPTQPEVDKDPQMTIYHHFAHDLYPGRPILMRLHFLKFDFLFETKPTDEAWTAAKKRVLGAASAIESGQFDPTPGGLCKYCDYMNLCPAMKHLFKSEDEQTEVFDGIDIKDTVREYIRLKEIVRTSNAQVDELATKIEGYMGVEGYTRLFVDNIVMSQVKTRRPKWDEERLIEVLNNLGLVEEVQGVREDMVNKLLDSDAISAEQKRELESCREIRFSYSLRYKFKGEDKD
ncbi:PD-(D/E)XK nuclease family protein [candidate division TA06 bacterium]|uniref:PD-(D/E)XK nuclease family protein n=1 Tax=candidate division TA06 bacterium TaxID=2250710 RepID=A0A523UMQ8_UNCT6|nr:MAG: PD-(D/E)XK nuclease family protein [candidate division TA06 bacterium]